jgi:hypothetical protein
MGWVLCCLVLSSGPAGGGAAGGAVWCRRLGLAFVDVIVQPLVHLPSTQQAVAHRRGSGCSIIVVHCCQVALALCWCWCWCRHCWFLLVQWPWCSPLLSWHCGCVLLSPISLLSPVLFHLSSTPRAVAHGAGGGWCVICQRTLSLPLLTVAAAACCRCRSTRNPPHEQSLVGVGQVLLQCLSLLLCPGEDGGGCVVSMSWQASRDRVLCWYPTSQASLHSPASPLCGVLFRLIPHHLRCE